MTVNWAVVNKRTGIVEWVKHDNKPVDRDNQDAALTALHAGRADDAKNPQRPTRPPTASKPPSLLAHPAQMALVIRRGLGLNRERHAARCDHHRVDVPFAWPRDGVTQSPSLAAKRIEGALDLVLRAGSDPAARGQGQPVPRPGERA